MCLKRSKQGGFTKNSFGFSTFHLVGFSLERDGMQTDVLGKSVLMFFLAFFWSYFSKYLIKHSAVGFDFCLEGKGIGT